MKTESEIYKACIDAGLKAGDIVRMSDGSNASVLSITDSIIYFSTFRIYKVPNIRLGFVLFGTAVQNGMFAVLLVS